MEINDTIGEAEGLVDISRVSDETKEKCKHILQEFLRRVELEKDKIDIYDLCRTVISDLLILLDGKDDEHKQLFESLRDVILKARDSVKGWKS